jgi:two-component system C4-dicarboxylate transport response regulator DctD
VLERLGSNTLIAVDCRVIAATKVDLLELSRQGLFRSDLYYRLNVVTVNLPRARERREDVALLFEHSRVAGRRPPPAARGRADAAASAGAACPRLARQCARAAQHGRAHHAGAGCRPVPSGTAPEAAASLAATMESRRSLISEALRNNEGSLTRTAQALHTQDHAARQDSRKYGL